MGSSSSPKWAKPKDPNVDAVTAANRASLQQAHDEHLDEVAAQAKTRATKAVQMVGGGGGPSAAVPIAIILILLGLAAGWYLTRPTPPKTPPAAQTPK